MTDFVIYPGIDEEFAFPPAVRQAIANSPELSATILDTIEAPLEAKADAVAVTARRGIAVPDVQAGYLYVTDTATGERKQITSGAEYLTGDPQTLGEGVLATISGVKKWVSPSGYPRPVETDFTKASIWSSSTGQLLGADLTAMLLDYGITTHYLAGAVGGFQISHIAAAAGVRPLLAEAFTIPAGTTPVTIVPTNMTEANNFAVPVAWIGSFAGSGIPGNLQKSASSSTWTFTRTTAGTATAVAAGTAYTPSRATEYQSGITIINPGKNTLTALTSEWTEAVVIDLTNKIYDFFSGAGRHVLVVGHFVDTDKPVDSITRGPITRFNDYMRARYGGRFFDLSAYLTGSQVWTDTALTPTADDLAQQALGNKPWSLSNDTQHLNQTADVAVTNTINAKLLALGWIAPPPLLTVIADDFNRPDGVLGSTSLGGQAWTSMVGSSTLPVISGNKMMNAESGARRAVVNAPSASADYEVSAKITALGATPGDKAMQIIVRGGAFDSYVYLSIRSNSSAEGASLWKVTTGGALTQIGTTNTGITSAVGQVWKLKVVGSTYTGYVDDVQVLEYTDATTPATGKPGLYLGGGSSSACAWDDFLVTKL